jgi:cytochrome P450
VTSAQLATYDPFAPGFTDDPYPHYADLRATNPVEANELGFYALWRHPDVSELLRSRLSVEDRNISVTSPIRELYDQVYAEVDIEGRRGGGMSMLDRDPPDHTRLRKLVSQAFTPRRIEELTPVVTRLVEEALARIQELGDFDLIAELAFPLPFQVITEMLGMPDVDTDRLRRLSGTIVRSLEPVPDVDSLRVIIAAELEIRDLAAEAIAWKRKNPADDLLTALVQAEDSGDVLSDDELVAQLILLYVAGHETTVNLIGNGALALLRAPDQLALWRERPDLDENAIEEFLRFDSPVQMSRRITLSDYDVDGVTIPAGRLVLGSLGSANRDEAVFGPDAHLLRLDRDNARQQVSFGAGVHHCLGAALARLEGRVALAGLVRRFPALRLADEPRWNGRINLRGLETLPLAI